MRSLMLFTVLILSARPITLAQDQVLDDRLHHLRIEGPREWSEFPEEPEAAHLELRFKSEANNDEWTLSLRQQDVKQRWNVLLNEKSLGQLAVDENDMRIYFAIPKGRLIDGENHLRIEQQLRGRKSPDDIRVGQASLISSPLYKVLNETKVKIEVRDQETNENLPARITITNMDGTLQTTGAKSNDHLAVRPGTVYTATGEAEIGLPRGRYKVYAGRGFEYSLDSAEIDLKAGDQITLPLKIRRGVPTEGYVACDTHVHTLTHSGHGDSSVQERMITLAAEGIELPIATDHNVQIDHRPFAREMHVGKYFTPVIGNEVTTPVGHFNVFPAAPDASVPNHKLNDWGSILDEIYRTPGVKVAILNHARDIHSGVRPFGPKRFNHVVGENLDGWPMRFNAMEVVNSSANQSDPLQLFEDWMALLNRGYQITPIGSSDSHDVARHFVGQGRTYIRADDRDPGRIDVDQAVANLLEGRVMVSYGLLVKMLVDEKYTSGDLATVPREEVRVRLSVLGPHWVNASIVRLYSNGRLIREIAIDPKAKPDLPTGVLWQDEITLPRPNHDVNLVAIASGPGVTESYWKTAKPYQPTSPDWKPQVVGCSGAVWLDGDRDGRKQSAYDYAVGAIAKSQASFPKLLKILGNYDSAVAAQAASLWQSAGNNLLSAEVQKELNQAEADVKRGFQDYIMAWRATEIARSRPEE